MKCCYPRCFFEARWIPVIELPTIRSSGESRVMIATADPTVLLAREVCDQCRESYNLMDWFTCEDWQNLQELARENGYHIPEPELMVVQFKPLGWHPRRKIELER